MSTTNKPIIFSKEYLNSPAALEDEFIFCREDFTAFIEKTFKIVTPGVEFKYNWHLHAIGEYLTACYKGQIKRLIINIPPRSLKSISCSVAWPAWLLGKDPTSKIMAASYSLPLSLKHSLDCRFMIESDWYKQCFPGTVIASDQNQKSVYITTQRGFRYATSVGGTTTGQGANFLILDDTMNATEAQSQTVRESTLTWIQQTWMSRLNDKNDGVMLLIEQRLHEKDATGFLLETGDWEHLELPAVFNKKTIIQVGNFKKEVQEGELLHEARESREQLESLKKTMGTYAFSAQYLLAPQVDGGGLFKRDWFKYYSHKKPTPKFEYVIQSYDTAFTDKTFNDPTAFTAWGVFSLGEGKGFGVMLIDAWQAFLEYPELRKKAQDEYRTVYGAEEGRRPDAVLIEKKGSGITLCQDLIRGGIPVRAYNPGRADKVQRAHSVTYLLENGLIYLPESNKLSGRTYSWAEEVVNQLCSFPMAEHDDFVDSTVQAWQLLRDQSWLTVDNFDEPYEEKLPRVNPYAQ